MFHPILTGALVAVTVLAVAWLLVWLVRSKKLTVAQQILWWLAVLLTRFQWRANQAQPPPECLGGAVIVSNHRSSVDPFFVQVCMNRPMRWMVAREYCEHPAFRWFLRTVDVIPVNRGGIDTAATRSAIRTVKEGGIVGMFPEGRINMSDEFMLPMRPGAVLVAIKAGVPLVPCYIEGSPYNQTPWSPFLMRARVRIRFGEPLEAASFAADTPDDRVVKATMVEVARRIAGLAGVTDFEPRFAGRRWKPTQEDLDQAMEASRRKNES